jgi:hypothetical protein
MRTSPGAIPTASRSSSVSFECVVLAGCVAIVRVSPEVGAVRDEPQRVHEAARAVDPAAHHEREHAAAVAHLPPREVVLRVAREERVAHPLHPRVPLERAGHAQRVRRVPLHPQRERLEALGQQPRVEGGDRRARVAREVAHVGDERPRPHHRAAERAPLPVDELGGGVHHEVGAEVERPLQRGRAEAVVHREHHPARAAERAQRREVDHLEPGVRRRLDEDELRRRAERGGPRLQSRGGVHVGRRDPPARQHAREELVRRAEQRARRHHVVPRASSAPSVANTAAIPLAVATPSSAPSSRQSFSTNSSAFGLE